MSSLNRSLLPVVGAAVYLALAGCGPTGTGPAGAAAAAQPLSENQKIALAQGARGEGLLLQDPGRAAECFKLALQAEPGNRMWTGELADALNRSGRTDEAIPLWKSLADGDDLEAKRARKMLAKAAAKPN
jgi:predicted Zn-dependent protease